MQFSICKPLFVLPCQAIGTGTPADAKAMAGKPKHCLTAGNTGMTTKILRVMKITAFFLLIVCLQVHANGFGQGITLSEKDAPLEKIFKEIRRQTGYQFFYSDKVLEGTKRVTIEVRGVAIEEVLKRVFEGQGLEWGVKDRTVIVRSMVLTILADTTNSSPKTPIDVKGKVIDENGNPLTGANVKVKGTGIGTFTNTEGYFTLNNLRESEVLEISFVGYETKYFSLKGTRDFTIKLVQKNSVLDETVVIAYGTTTKRLNTGNVSTIKSTEIEKQPVTNPILALQGRVPGLIVTQTTGISGSAVNIRIQGRNNLNSLYTGSDPLIVVDGVPYPSQNLTTFQAGSSGTTTVLGPSNGQFTASGSTLALINPDDIESIDVLKDADATAIYGSRAANGAILITTKKGKAGDTRVKLGFQSGWGKVVNKWDLLNTQQYLEMRQEAKRNDNAAVSATDYDINGLWDTTRYTDWQDILIGSTAQFTRATATVSGGNNNSNYLVGGTYSRETTVFPGDFANSKASVHFNINTTSINKRFQLQLTGNFLVDNNNVPGGDFTRFIALAPVAPPLYNSDGSLNWMPNANGNSSWENPLASYYYIFENKSNNLVGNAIIGYKLFQGLVLKANLGYNQMRTDQFLAPFDAAFAPETRATITRGATFSNNVIKTWIIEPQLTFNTNILKRGKLDVLLGTTFQENANDGVAISALGHSSDNLLRNLSAATTINSTSVNAIYRYNAFFGRLNYIHNNRYLLNLSARRDGSSRFGSQNQFHNFGAVGVGWIFSEENFIKHNFPVLSFGKLRGSYGITGNDQVGNYSFMSLFRSTFNSLPYQTIRGLESSGISNPYLQWEETRKLQAGIDLGFNGDRIILSANYFRNRSGNTLNNVALPIITGTALFLDNFPASIQNAGWELSLKSDNIRKNYFSWTTNINVTVPKNKLVSFPGLENSSMADLVIVGQSLNISKNYSFYGIDPQTGNIWFSDAKGNVTATPDFNSDRISILNIDPDFYGGLQNMFTYKGVQLDFLFQYVKQDGWNFLDIAGIPGGFSAARLGNQPTTVLDRWQKPGDITATPRYRAITSSTPIQGNRAFGDASFVRLKNASISYQFPKLFSERLHIKEGRLFIHGQNLLTFTSYWGLDPETQSINTLPPLRILTVGANVTL